MLLLLLPFLLIGLNTVVGTLKTDGRISDDAVWAIGLQLIGQTPDALLITVIAAVFVLSPGRFGIPAATNTHGRGDPLVGAPQHVVVMGVSGTGKTIIGKELAGAVFVEGDQFHPQANIEKMSSGIPLDDDDRRPWLQALAARIRELDEQGRASVTGVPGGPDR
ncbi:gluconokinase [Ornithinimicrobium cerasi]|uniref:gluconokinase n=1 Tax=Ornithinimicrobium cerasi TaxID=2248773 RepID=UPI00301DDA46